MTHTEPGVAPPAGYPAPGEQPPRSTPPSPGEPPEAKNDWLEVFAATLLGLAAIAIAWSAYQSSLWGGKQDAALTESVRENNVATDLFQTADRIRTFDQTLFLELLSSGVCEEGTEDADFVCEQIFANVSPEGVIAIDEWFDNDELAPFDSEAYNDAIYAPGLEADESSDAFFADATAANENGDDYELASTLLATVLFFAGISVVIVWPLIRKLLLGAGAVLLVGSGVFLATLPLA